MTYLDLLKFIEDNTGMKRGDVSGDTNLKIVATDMLNRAMERYLSMGGVISKTDDTNYTNQNFSLFDIEEDQNDYEFLEDKDGNKITDITAVLMKRTATSNFVKLDKLTLDNPNAELILSPNSTKGVPTSFLERNSSIFFNVIPNFSLLEGGKLFYKRVPSYFTTADTTKTPGINPFFHEMVGLRASYSLILINKPNARSQIKIVRDELTKFEDEFKTYEQLRSPLKSVISPHRESTR